VAYGGRTYLGARVEADFKARFKALGNFPSPPGIAQQIVALAKNPDATIADVSAAISKDPALATKVLRTANSALYAQRRQSQNLRQALTVMGLDAAMTLCLGFSIAGSFRSGKAGKIDYTRYWRHSLLGALSGRCIGEELGLKCSEDVFLAGLLQDIGVLALDRVKPGFYAELPPEASHTERIAYERAHLDEDHAALGAWMLDSWNLPKELCDAVRLSHSPEQADRATEAGKFVCSVALGGELAAAFLSKDAREAVQRFPERALAVIGLRPEQVGHIVERVTQLTPELGRLFDTTLLSADDAIMLTEQAQELLAARTVESLHEIDSLKHAAHSLAARTEQLEDANRRDGLTGLYNRRHLDDKLASEFAAARAGGWDLSLLFIDLDHFKRINDTLGHQAGDLVLKQTATLLQQTLRAEDILARYGGEEFVILLPGIPRKGARGLGERILASLRQFRHRCGETDVIVTASLGLASHSAATPFSDVSALVGAADEAVYAAKRAGRNCIAEHGAAAAGIALVG
jgi:diguanylate cyclase (GGDEF)-like protein